MNNLNDNLYQALELIKSYCLNSTCDDCPFRKDGTCCLIYCPEDWRIPARWTETEYHAALWLKSLGVNLMENCNGTIVCHAYELKTTPVTMAAYVWPALKPNESIFVSTIIEEYEHSNPQVNRK